MRIDRISIRNFKGFEERTLNFPRPLEVATGANGSVHVVIGENGTGKTTALDALAVAITHAHWSEANTLMNSKLAGMR